MENNGSTFLKRLNSDDKMGVNYLKSLENINKRLEDIRKEYGEI